VTEWLFARCTADRHQRNRSRTDGAAAASLAAFQQEVVDAAASVLVKRAFRSSGSSINTEFSSTNWTLADFDAIFKPGIDLMNDVYNDDGCGDLLTAMNPFTLLESVYIIGDLIGNRFLRRQRDFVLRDLLGCIPQARICTDGGSSDNIIDSENEVVECKSMLNYAQKREHMRTGILSGSAASAALPNGWECGRCNDNVDGLNVTSILISSLNGLSQSNKLSRHHVDWGLKARWQPKVIIHLDDEAETPVNVLADLYRGSFLVLRMYNHGSASRLSKQFYQSSTRVLTIPIGYLNGATGFVDADGKSGTTSARESLRSRAEMKGSALYRWAFVGTRGMHHPHTTDARTAMTSFLSGLEGSSKVHLTERDG
jgi:hypothetical protein